MSKLGIDAQLAAARNTRNAARMAFTQSLSRVKTDLDPATLAARLKVEVAGRSRDAAQQALEIAGDNRGVLIGVVSAVALVLARRPLVARGLWLLRLPLWARLVPWRAGARRWNWRAVLREGTDAVHDGAETLRESRDSVREGVEIASKWLRNAAKNVRN